MQAISSMFEDHDMVCEEKSTQDYLIWEVEDEKANERKEGK